MRSLELTKNSEFLKVTLIGEYVYRPAGTYVNKCPRDRFGKETTMLARLLIVFAVHFLVACSAPAPEPDVDFRLTATIKDIMDSVVDPSADEIWGSVAFTVEATGVQDKFPRTDEEWKAVRRSAIRLLEGTNLLLMPGRHVAKPHEKSENPGIELEPEQIETLINNDRQTFQSLAHGLHDSALVALKAIDAKDKDALLDSGDGIDQACENCHLKYWYPNEAKTQGEQRQVPAPPRPGTSNKED